METVAGFTLGLEEAQMDLRKPIKNILDWESLRRKSKIDKIHETILARTKSGKRGAPSPPNPEASSRHAKTHV